MKKLGFLFFLWIAMLLTGCGEIEFEPVTVEGFEITTTVEQVIDQGIFSLTDDELVELLLALSHERHAQDFTFYLELIDWQLADEEVVEIDLPMLEIGAVIIEMEGHAVFEAVTFYHAGTYTFRIFQSLELTDDLDLLHHWQTDPAYFYVVVTVTEDEEAEVLRATVDQDVAVFVNELTLYLEETIRSRHRPLTYDEVNFEMYSEYALLINLSNGLVLFEHQADVRTYPASVTKLMTVLVGLEHGNMDDSVLINADFDRLFLAEAMQAGFVYGEVRSFSEVIHAVLLPSGGEATEALANHVAGSYEAFVELMNIKARELGMYDTHFATATGLHDDNHYTTANDIAILLHYALEIPEFKAMLTRESYELERPNSRTDTLWSTLFYFAPTLDFDGGEIIGGRTGFTTAAGRCLASLATNGEEEFLLITFGAIDDDPESIRHILDALMIYGYFLQEKD